MTTPWRDKCEGDGWTMYLGDCREIMPTLTGIDAVVTDPPYGISHASNHVCDTTTAKWMNTEIENDHDTSLRDDVLSWCGTIPWCMFGSIKMPAPENTRGFLVWDKGPESGMGDLSFPWKLSFELVFIGGDGWSGSRDEGVIKGRHVVTRASMGRLHPNEKPATLIRHIIDKLPVGCTVFDPFSGSGTTGVACIETGRRFVGIEIDENYYRIACNRLRSATPCLFGRTQ